MSASVKQTVPGDALEAVIAQGDLAKLTPEQRVAYYRATCESLGLNPLTKPFEYITLNGRLTLYARKDAADQLRRSRGVSIIALERERLEGIYIVTATAQDVDGRQDSSIGAVNIEGLKGDALANAMMKAETKAKRRVTLSICGLGWTDEIEIETIPGAKPALVDVETGQIEPEPHWADKPYNGGTLGEHWLVKAAEKRSLTTTEVMAMLHDLHIYDTPAEAVATLDEELAKRVAEVHDDV